MYQRIHYIRLKTLCCLLLTLVIAMPAGQAQERKHPATFVLSMHPATQQFRVQMTWTSPVASPELKLPAWTPGYYQFLPYAQQVSNFSARDENDNPLAWERSADSGWIIQAPANTNLKIEYAVLARRKFVATNYLDSSHAYIVPAGTFMYPEGFLQQPVSVQIIAPEAFPRIATGLKSVVGKRFQYHAPDYDILYDCPILAGNLQEAPPFYIQNKAHRFISYNAGAFDSGQLMTDLRKIVQAAVDIIDHIPYDEYSFIGIGPGAGGIEHLNNTTVSFTGAALANRKSRIRLYNFLAHEYFHHYNAKRIRPLELGPFDYQKGSKTNLLWIAEGLSVYYEYIILRRAGLSSVEDFFESIGSNIIAFENKPGKAYQSLTEASLNTWTDGPFGTQGKDPNRSISYYDKGPVVGMLLDLAIREKTRHTKSLDDVMRALYHEYYRNQNRGFTETEFWDLCTKIAGDPLTELKAYTQTTKAIDYEKFLGAAGLELTSTRQPRAQPHTGLFLIPRQKKAIVSVVEKDSPAALAGLQAGDELLAINGVSGSPESIAARLNTVPAGTPIELTVKRMNRYSALAIIPQAGFTQHYSIRAKKQRTSTQERLMKQWLHE